MTVEHRTIAKTIAHETIGQYFNRTKSRKPNKPLRSIKEMAEEFGVSYQTLAATIKHKNGPLAKYKTGTTATITNTWYDPDSLRKWWKELKK